MAETIDVKANDIIKIMRGLSKEDQKYILKIIVDSIFPQKKVKKEKKRKPLLVPSPNIPIERVLVDTKDGFPRKVKNEQYFKERRLTEEQLAPLIELFEDAPPAEELIKMLTS